MSRFLRVFAVIFSLFFVGNAFAAGYTCSSYKKYTSCNAGYYLTGTAVGNSCAACPSGWTSAGGTTVGMAASCFKDITLNKNGFSTTIAAGAGTGCTVQANATGTNPATLRVYYNTACTLPTISSTTSGAYIYYNWSKNSANIAASSVTTIAATTTAPTDTYYIRKQSCAANYYKNNSTTCTACPSTYPTSSAGTNGADRCFAACAAGTRKTTVSQVGCSTTAGGWMTAAHRVYNGNVSPEILAPYPYNTNTSTVVTYHNALLTTTGGTARSTFTGTMPAGHSVMGVSGYITAYGARIINIDTGSFAEMELIEFNVIPQGSTLTGNTSTAPYSGAYNPELSVIHGAEDLNFFATDATDGDYSTASAIPSMDSLEYEFGGAANIAFVQVTFAHNYSSNAYEIQLDTTGNGNWVSITGNQTTPTSTYTVNFDSNSGVWQTRILPAIAWVPCAAGKYRGGLNSNWYLISNQTACSNVTAGYWNNGGGTNATGGVISGKSGGTIAAGRWGAAGATTAQGSGAVNAGYYSTGGGTSATPTAAGDGCISSKACGKVTAGCYTTSTGSTSACPNTCPGLYVNSAAGSDSINDCYFTTTAGKYIADKTDTAQKDCEAAYYCPSATLYYPNAGNRLDCPAYTDRLIAVADYPENYYDATFRSAYNITWGTNKSAITQCRVSYSFYNSRGNFVDTLNYNTDTGKYDTSTGTTLYYSSVNPGYYLKTKYSETYCNVSEGSTNRMYYREALPCPENSYCEGYATLPLCTSGDYNDTLGVTACSTLGNGYDYSAGGTSATSSAACYLTLGTGKFVETAGADQKTCTAGGYCAQAGSKIYYGSTGGRTACSAGTYNSNSGSTASSACQSCPAGYYGSSTGLTTSTCSGLIAAGYWGTAGATSNTGSGTVNGGYYSTAGGTSATPTANGNGCVGTGNTCGKLSAEYYSNGGSTTNGATCISGKVCGTCNTNYRANTSTGKTAATQCQTSCAPGTAVLSANAACATVTGNRYKTGTALVNYGSISPTATDVTSNWNAGTVYSCLSNYTISGTAASNHDARTDCTISCAPGTQIASANATSCTTPTGTTWYTDTTHSVSAGSSSGSNVKTCNTSYATANTATATDHDNANDCKTTCAAGTWVASAGAACGDVGNGYYTTASQTISQGSIGSRSQCSALNAFYTNSDSGRNATADCYGYATATKYVAEAGKGAVTCSGGYCPGDNTTKIYYASGNGATTGGRSTLSNWTCPSGADAASDCYRGVTLNKNSMSGTLTLPSSSGCRSIGGATGTTSDTVYVYYNTACKLPTTALSATATGTTYTGTGTWATSSTASSGFVNSITLTDTSSTTPVRYAGKMYTCSAGYHLPAKGTACSSCVAGNWCAGISNKYYSTSAQGLSSCSSNLGTGYTSKGGTADTANTKCYLPVSAGYIRSGTSGTTTAACDAGKYKTAHDAYYGSSYSCSNVTAGYWNNGGGTNATGGVISGKSGGTIAAGRWGAAGATTDQGSGAVNAGYYSTGGGTSATPTKAGTGCLSSKACGKVTAGCYTTSTGSTVACPNTCPGDMTSDAGSDAKTDCKITCTAGNYLAANTGVCATCTKGNYCANNGTYNFNASSNQGIAACSGANQWQANTGKTSCDTVTDGMYKSNNYTLQNCGTGSYCKSGVKTACPNSGTTSSATASLISSCYKTGLSLSVSNGAGTQRCFYTSGSGSSAVYDTSCDTKTVTKCNAKYYRANSSDLTCTTVGTGYYSPADSLGRTQCPTADSGWAVTSPAGTTYSDCYETKTGSAISSYCNAGILKRTASSTSAYNTTATISTALKAIAGAYVNGQTCTYCPAGKYQATNGSTATSCSSSVNKGYYNTGCGTSATGGVCNTTNFSGGKVSANCYADTTGSTSACPKSCSSLGGGLYKNSAAGSDAETDCYFATTAGNYMVAATDTAQTKCPIKQYCESETLYYPNVSVLNDGGWNDCPAIDGHIMSSVTSDNYKAYASNATTPLTSAVTISKASQQSWSTGLTKKSACKATYTFVNEAGTLVDESVAYNTETDKYDIPGGNQYYAKLNAGYWLNDRYSSTYCDGRKETDTQKTLYKKAVVCPANSYCPGYTSIPKCYGNEYPEGGIGKNSCETDTTNYPNSAEKSGSINSCYLTTTSGKFVKTANAAQETCTCGGYCPGSIKVNYGSTGGKTDCAAGTYNGGTGSSASSVCKTTSAGYYALAGSCSQTQVNANCWGGAGSKVACPNSCTSPYSTSAKGSDDANDCYLTTTAKNYVKTAGAGQTTCAAGTYCPGGSVIYKGGTVSGRNTTGGSTTCPAGSFCAAGVSAGTECVLGSYSAAGASACTACQDGKTTSTKGAISCNATCSNASGVSDWETASWATTNVMTNLCTIAASAGCSENYYKNNNACSTCSSGTGSKYTFSAAGTTSVNSCYLKTSTGKYVATKGAGETACISPYYCPGGTTVYYGTGTTTGGNSPCTGIASIYNASDASASKQAQCFAKTSPGKYIKATGTSETTCPAGDYCPGGTTVYYGSAGGNKDCPSGYTNGTTGYSLESQCLMRVAGGKYVATAKESVASGTCDAGYAKPEHTVNYGGTSSCNPCTGATYQPDTGQSSCLTCPTYEAYSSKVLGQQYWTSSGVHDTKEGCQVRMNEPVADDTGDYDGKVYCSYSNTAGDYSSCWVYQQANSCIDGYYYAAGVGKNTQGTATTLKGNVCKPVESGYWSAADTLTRTECATGLVTCGAGKCANEAADCGRKLHAGDQTIYLRSAARTSPALNVKIGNQTFFGALSTAYSSKLKVKKDNTTYSVVNDYQ